ncbi:MAG: hypothetical protein HQ519_03485 [Planctomycetes bacterium]|nr:hypothetical protein [Planctomycetota bacterium]
MTGKIFLQNPQEYMKNRITLLLIALISTITLSVDGTSRPQKSKSYDPSLGTLPTEQGFWLLDSGGAPAPTLANGELLQGPTSFGGYQHYYAYFPKMDWSTEIGFIEAELKFIESTNVNNPCNRMGYELGLRNGDEGGGIAWIADGIVGLQTSECTLTYAPTAGTDQWNKYRLEVTSTDVVLFINGTEVLRAPNWPSFGFESGYAFFGDGTDLGYSESALRELTFGPYGGLGASHGILQSTMDANFALAVEPGSAFAGFHYRLSYTPISPWNNGLIFQTSVVPISSGFLDADGRDYLEIHLPKEMLVTYAGMTLAFQARVINPQTGLIAKRTRTLALTVQ